MTNTRAGRQGTRFLVLGAALAVLVAIGVGVHVTRDPRGHVIDGPGGTAGWKTIEFEDIRVDIPVSWERSDRSACEFPFEQWGPPGEPPCEPEAVGVAFYRSATFDPAHGPGVMSTRAARAEANRWAGYVYARDLAVYAADDDRAVVEGILGSVA